MFILKQVDESAAEWMELALESLEEDFMPLTVILGQLPKEFQKDNLTLSCEYTPIFDNEKLVRILMIITDITEELGRKKFERAQKEIIGIFDCISRDKNGFVEYVEESNSIIETLSQSPETADATLTKRLLHTLKGNSGVFEVTSMFDLCHLVEEQFEENGQILPAESLTQIQDLWSSLLKNFDSLLGDRTRTLDINEKDLIQAISALKSGESGKDVAKLLSSWRFEPTFNRLTRIADQAKGIAARLDKGEISVNITGNELRIPNKKWSSFWTTFIHAVRNAVDHGLESESMRKELGKDQALISLNTLVNDENFVIEISDDGRGIDWDRIKENCIKNGLPHSNSKELTDSLFLDGVTSREIATAYSGRGVGMGAVKDACESLGGKITVDSTRGKGTKFSFEFPIATMHSADEEEVDTLVA